MPTVDGSAVATSGDSVIDLVASQEIPGVEKAEWTLDPLQRFSTQSTFAWVNDGWASSTEQVLHYDGDGDEPGWIVEDATQPDKITRWVEGADGQIAVQTGKSGDRVLQLVDLHGDVVGTVPVADGADRATWPSLQLSSYDEFGNPLPMSGAATSNAPPARYGCLGAAQRSADTPTGVLLMGVRLYHPLIGRFLQVDPVAGGSANAYDYCNADPVNCTDLGGTIAWGKVLGVVARVGEVASFIPGPIGAAAAGVSAVAYAASGNKGKALEMGITAAAQRVGAGGGVRAAFKVASLSAKAGQKAKRALAQAARSVVQTGRDARDAVKIVRAARKNVGMGPGKGREYVVSQRAADWAWRMWVGRGARSTSVGGLLSRNGLRQYRPPTRKPEFGFSPGQFREPHLACQGQ